METDTPNAPSTETSVSEQSSSSLVHDNAQQWRAALAAAKAVFPEVPSAYKLSGSTPISAALLMLVCAPILAVLLIVVDGAICYGWALVEIWLHDGMSDGGRTGRRAGALLALVSIAIDIGIVASLIIVPGLVYARISRFFKVRQATISKVLSGLVALVAAAVLFLPLFKGASLAPTDISFIFIPIKWPIMILALLVGPLGAAAYASDRIKAQKFCELANVYLRPMRKSQVNFEELPAALDALRSGDFPRLAALPEPLSIHRKKRRHGGEVILWWHERAETAFVEVTVHLFGQILQSGKSPNEQRESWLAYSEQLNYASASAACQAMPERAAGG